MWVSDKGHASPRTPDTRNDGPKHSTDTQGPPNDFNVTSGIRDYCEDS